jgi:hypothetical protein
MQNDGNFVIYQSSGLNWNTGTHTGAGTSTSLREMIIGSGTAQTTTDSADHKHKVTPKGTVAVSGNHTHTLTSSGTVTSTFTGTEASTGNTGSGTSFSNLDPYITVYMYKRTA